MWDLLGHLAYKPVGIESGPHQKNPNKFRSRGGCWVSGSNWSHVARTSVTDNVSSQRVLDDTDTTHRLFAVVKGGCGAWKVCISAGETISIWGRAND